MQQAIASFCCEARKERPTNVVLHILFILPLKTDVDKNSYLILILLCELLIWYTGIYTNTYSYMTTVLCSHIQILSSLEALPIDRLGGVS